jgi:hypothetical protein
MTTKAIRPEDIIPNGADHTLINGKSVRKGSVCAFIANIDLLENLNSSDAQRANALQALKELAPALITVGLHHHVNFKNKQAEELIQQAAIDSLIA